MPLIYQGQASDATTQLLDVWTLNSLRNAFDVYSLDFQIWDVHTDALMTSPTQMYPSTPGAWQAINTANIPTGQRIGTGHYYAPYTISGSQAPGNYEIRWRFRASSTDTSYWYYREIFEVLPATITASANAVIAGSGAGPLTASINAVIQVQGVAQVAQVNAVIQQQGRTLADVAAPFSGNPNTNAVIQETQSVAAVVNGVIQTTFTIGIPANAVIGVSGLTHTADANAVIENAEFVEGHANAVIQGTETRTASANAIILGEEVRFVTANAVIQATGLTHTATINAVIAATHTHTADANAIISQEHTVSADINAVINNNTERSLTASCSAIIIETPTPPVPPAPVTPGISGWRATAGFVTDDFAYRAAAAIKEAAVAPAYSARASVKDSGLVSQAAYRAHSTVVEASYRAIATVTASNYRATAKVGAVLN